jgi:hypothetical protein
VQIFAGFFCGLMGLLSGIGSALVAHGNNDGLFMIGFCVFFTGLFGYIVIQQKIEKIKNAKSTKQESSEVVEKHEN